MDWFTSDLHFGHKKLALLRGYATVQEHDEDIVRELNKYVAALDYSDTLYILGDLSFHKPTQTADLLADIRCKKVLVKGNHDHRTANKEGAELPGPVRVELSEFHHYLERTFKVWTVRGGEPTYDEAHVVMFHFPLMHWRNQDKGWWMLHGHLHGAPSMVPGKTLDVGWDAWMRPLSLHEISEKMNGSPLRANHHEGRAF
jgi:calcineurin-like phosphoesterase family protein